jgi:hypothetical protein
VCLTYVTKRYKKKRTSGWAYKVLADINDHTVLTPYQSARIRRGCWVQAERILLNYEYGVPYGQEYTSGFHLWAEKPYTLALVLKVRYRGAHTFGVQWGADVIVADEIYIPKTRKKMVK